VLSDTRARNAGVQRSSPNKNGFFPEQGKKYLHDLLACLSLKSADNCEENISQERTNIL